MKKVYSLILVLVLIVPIIVPAKAEVLTEDSLLEKSDVVALEEVKELRETNSETYRLSDGSYECIVYADDKYYVDKDGEYVEINNTIEKIGKISSESLQSKQTLSKEQYEYVNKSNKFKAYFQHEKPAFMIENDGHMLEVILDKSNEVTAFVGGSIKVDDIADHVLSGENFISYYGAYTDTDFIYSVQNEGVKEYIILNSIDAPNEYSFIIYADGCKIQTYENTLIMVNNDGQEVFRFGTLYAVDSNGEYTEDLWYDLVEMGNGNFLIKVSIDPAYLSDSNRTFPVLIDPTLMITGETNTYDTYVSSRYPSTNYYLNTYLRTGKDEDYYVRRSYIKFDIPASVYDGVISSADLDLKMYSGASPNVTAYLCTGQWSSSTLNWNNKPGYTSTNAATFNYLFDDWYRADVTKIVKNWVSGSITNNGFVVKDATESNTNQWTTFYSSDAESPNKPELYINYFPNKYARLVGVTNTNHDHSTCLTTIKPMLENCDLSGVYKHTGAFSIETIQGYLDSYENGVFISRSHGGPVTVVSSGNQVGTHIKLDNIEGEGSVAFKSNRHLSSLDLSNMILIMFIGCKTGLGGNGGLNLPTVAVERGAQTAVGFKNNLDCSSANSWTTAFVHYMEQGVSVEAACSALAGSVAYDGSGLETYVVCGNRYTKLN